MLSKKRVPLKALLLLVTFAFGSFTVSGTVLPFTISDAHKTTGSFVLTISPSVLNIPQGMNITSTVTILSTQGFAGTVALTAQVASGIAVVFNPSGVNVPVGGTATSITTVQAAKNASIGTYDIIATGMAVAGRKVLSSSALLTATVNPQGDFGVYAYPYSITVVAGFTNYHIYSIWEVQCHYNRIQRNRQPPMYPDGQHCRPVSRILVPIRSHQ